MPEENEVKPWSGEGLPPVRTVCDYKHVHEWQKVEVFAVKPNYNGSHTALFTYENGCWGGCAEPSFFRPIRTPEQIAMEERDLACRQLLKDAYQDESAFALVQAGRLYDEGWRKQVTP